MIFVYLDYPKLVRMKNIIEECNRLTFHLTFYTSNSAQKQIHFLHVYGGSHLYSCHYHLPNHPNSQSTLTSGASLLLASDAVVLSVESIVSCVYTLYISWKRVP